MQQETDKVLSGQVAVVTGAGRGIGRALAVALAGAGADVALLARTRSQLEEAQSEVRQAGVRSLVVECDVVRQDQVSAAAAAVERELGAARILINNAGGSIERRGIQEADLGEWWRTVEVNAHSALLVTYAFLPQLKAAAGATVINIGSGMGRSAGAANSAYRVGKAALWMLTQCLAAELWEHSITVNELIPGPVRTDATREAFPRDAPPFASSEWVKEPQDVAPLALFLATQGRRGPTGQSFSLCRRPL